MLELSSLGKSAFKKQKVENWEEGRSSFMIEENSIYFSQNLLNDLHLNQNDRISFAYVEGKTYICNVTDKEVPEVDSFRITATSGDYKGSSKCRNQTLINVLVSPKHYNLEVGKVYNTGIVNHENVIYTEVIIPSINENPTTNIG